VPLRVLFLLALAAQQASTSLSEQGLSRIQLPKMPPTTASGGAIEEYRTGLEEFRRQIEDARSKRVLPPDVYTSELEIYHLGIDTYRDRILRFQPTSIQSSQRSPDEMRLTLEKELPQLDTRLKDNLNEIREAETDAEFGRAFLKAQREVLDGVKDPEFEALRSYITEHFASAQADVEAAGDLTPEVKQSIMDRITSLLATINGAATQIALNVTVVSQPAGARVVIRPKYGNRERIDLTEAHFNNVYRGLYVYDVQLAGFKPARDDLDLLDNSAPKLTCSLVSLTSPEDSGCSRE
jgi:hypothetical protein